MQNANLQFKIQNFKKFKKELPKILRNVFLARYTTFRIGGAAKYFFIAKTNKDLADALSFAKKYHLPFFILGNGSNLLVSDKGYPGIVINFQFSIFNFQKSKIIAGAGAPLGKLVNASAEKSLTGLEWAVGIPGTVGGAIYGNAGAFGKSMADIVKSAEVLEIQNARIKIFKKSDCKFSYRDSVFKHKQNIIILSCEIELKKGSEAEIKKRTEEYLNYRKDNQPLNFPSAGSVFKNYESKISNKRIIKEFPEIEGFNKNKLIPAAFLIEKCGLKGKKIGGVTISEKHANFILNTGGGKAKDVKRLIAIVKQKIKKKFGIMLKEEIIILGAI